MIKEIATPKLKNPIFIAAWPGMGEVAYRSGIFLREALGFKAFAKLESQDFFKPAAVSVDKGIIDIPNMPAGFFYYHKGKNHPDIILFLGEAQPPLEYAEALSEVIIEYVKKYKVKLTITFAAKPESIDHKNDSKVWMALTHSDNKKSFEALGLKTIAEGQISGLNGIILGVGKRNGIKGVCLLAEIPFYTVQIENPRAVASVLDVVSNYLKINLNVAPVSKRAKFIEEEIDKLINYLKGEAAPSGPSPLNDEDVEKLKKDLATYTKLPQSARKDIENIFQEAKKDITLANKLKKELDRWNVYREYEDRFLDLFKKKNKGKDIQ